MIHASSAPASRNVPSFLATVLVAIALAGCVTASGFVMAPFTSADGRFTVAVPDGKMTEVTKPGGGVYAGSTVHFWTGGLSDGPRLAVVYADATAATGFPESVLDDSIQSNLDSTGGNLVEQDPITVHGLAGREERVSAATKQYIFRMFVVGNRLYSVSVTGSAQGVGTAHALVFLDSFDVLP
jgi:hypothetical protein